MKTGWDFRGLVFKTGVEKDNFCSELDRVMIWRTGRHTPTKNSQEYPQTPPVGLPQPISAQSEQVSKFHVLVSLLFH